MIENLDERTYALLFAVRRSVRYHERRRRFYEAWNTATVAGGVLGGSVAATAVLAGWGEWSAAVAASVAVLSALDLAVGTGRRADRHGDFMRRFIALERQFAHGGNLEDDEYRKAVRERLAIESSEPPVLRLLDVLCHYEVLRSVGGNPPPKMPWWRRKLAPWLSQTDFALTIGKTV